MERQVLRPDQLEKFAWFLNEHPAFSPLLTGENALVYGFQIGNSCLGIGETERLNCGPAAPRSAEAGAVARVVRGRTSKQ
jgi:hypothetical protein